MTHNQTPKSLRLGFVVPSHLVASPRFARDRFIPAPTYEVLRRNNQDQKKPLFVLAGPTASGKTALAKELVQTYPFEIVSADSRQVYKRLDIGTGKDKTLPQHMINVVSPPNTLSSLRKRGSDSHLRGNDVTNFSVSDYRIMALPIMDAIWSKGKIPLVVGGTGYYIEAVVFEHTTNTTPPDVKVRRQLEQLSDTDAFAELQKQDPATAARIGPYNRRRMLRALEIIRATGRPVRPLKRVVKPDIDVAWYVLDVPREDLYQRIDQRVDARLKQGMVEEVQQLLNSGVKAEWLMSLGLEYRWITEYLLKLSSQDPDGLSGDVGSMQYKIPRLTGWNDSSEYDQMTQKLKFAIHAYARRQITYFKRWPAAKWLDSDSIKNEVGQILSGD